MGGKGRFKDITGRVFGKLTVTEQAASVRTGNGTRAKWRCRCVCGRERTTTTDQLTGGAATNCGECRGTHRHTAGYGKTPTYHTWGNMLARCTQPSNPAFAHYRRRGIKVCARWRVFANFLADMGERPSRQHTVERIRNDGNYEPGNCRWATKREQANNRLTNRRFCYRGQEYSLADLARLTGVSKEILRSRLCRSKLPWTVEGAVSTPRLPKTMTKAGFHA